MNNKHITPLPQPIRGQAACGTTGWWSDSPRAGEE